jgi:hypothetical protein
LTEKYVKREYSKHVKRVNLARRLGHDDTLMQNKAMNETDYNSHKKVTLLKK